MVYSENTTEGRAVVVKMDPVSFSKRLHEARTRAGLTQQQVADACGLTKGAVSAWENGVTDSILAENLFCVADALGVDPRWLATGQESETASMAALSPEIRAAIRALIDSMKR